MTEIQQHLLELIKEIDNLCRSSKGKIEYSLADKLAWDAVHYHGFSGKTYQASLMMSRSSFDTFQEVSMQQMGDLRSFEKVDDLHYRYVDATSLLLDITYDTPWNQHGVAIDIKIGEPASTGSPYLRYKQPDGEIIELPRYLFLNSKEVMFEDVPLSLVDEFHLYLSALCGCDWMTKKWPYEVRTEGMKVCYDPKIAWELFIARPKIEEMISPGYKEMAFSYNCKRREEKPALDKADQHRRLIDLTGARFDYWERLYPQKARILKLAEESDFEALLVMLQSYLEELEQCWKHRETLVFDLDILEALKPFLQKRYGAKFVQTFWGAIPEAWHQNLSLYLREQNIQHPLLGPDEPSYVVKPVNCTITSLAWKNTKLLISCNVVGSALPKDLVFSFEDDASGVSIFQTPAKSVVADRDSFQADFVIDLGQVLNENYEKGLLEARTTRALRFVLKSDTPDFRLVLGNSREPGVFNSFISAGYQDERAVLIPEETSCGNFVFWMLPQGSNEVKASTCGQPIARKKRPPLNNLLIQALLANDYLAAKGLLANKDYLDELAFSYTDYTIKAAWRPSVSGHLLEVEATHLMSVQVTAISERKDSCMIEGTVTIPAQKNDRLTVDIGLLLCSATNPARVLKESAKQKRPKKILASNCNSQQFSWKVAVRGSLSSKDSDNESKTKRQLYLQIKTEDFSYALLLRNPTDDKLITIFGE